MLLRGTKGDRGGSPPFGVLGCDDQGVVGSVEQADDGGGGGTTPSFEPHTWIERASEGVTMYVSG